MQPRYDRNAWEAPEVTLWHVLGRNLPLLLFTLLAAGGLTAVYYFFSPTVSGAEVVAANRAVLSAAIEKNVPPKPVYQRLAQSPGPLRVGIISGHKGNDAGAVCEDGLTEAEVNQRIAMQVVTSLNMQGIRTDLLDEFDPRLNGYSATALVSIHADSCDYYNDQATGYKLAGSSYTDSTQLEGCVEQAYGAATQLPYHANTITLHMTDYHAFREIAVGTPAIIIETGFMNLDREWLTTKAEIPAQAITDGILCFVQQARP